KQRVLHNYRRTAGIGGDTAKVIADRLAGMVMQRELLEFVEEIPSHVVCHALTQADVTPRRPDTNAPTQKEKKDGSADAPPDQPSRRVTARQPTHEARQRWWHRGGAKHIINQESHGPGFKQSQEDVEQLAGDNKCQWPGAAESI